MRFQNSQYESRWTMYMQVMYIPCTTYVMYIQFTTLYEPCSYSSEQYKICWDTYMTCWDMYIHWHKFILMHVHVYTWPNNVYSMYMSSMYNFMCLWTWKPKSKKLLRSGFEHVTLCISGGCLNHCTTSIVEFNQLCQYISIVVPGGWWRTSGAGPAPRPRHDVAGPSINMDLVEAEVHREAGRHSSPARLRNSPGRATWRAAGSCSINTD